MSLNANSLSPDNGDALEEQLRKIIYEQGPLPLDRFQEIALYNPLKGYYATQEVLGKAGDFITAPEVSQLFGEMLGIWLWDVLRQMNFPEPFQLLELGPGRGVLMADLLRTWEKLQPTLLASFNHDSHLSFLEINPKLKAKQAETLKSFSITPHWYQTLPHALAQGRGPLIVIANEFWDALPIKQYQFHREQWFERGVGIDKATDQLTYVHLTHQVKLETTMQLSEPFEGAIWEHSPGGEAVFQAVAQALKSRGGVLWMGDYGYTHASFGETLQGLFSGEPSPVLQHIGQTDLSAHVPFGRLEALACQQNLSTFGPIEQGVFLEKLGIQLRLSMLKEGKSASIRGALEAGYQRLVDPLAMGSLFKIFAASPHFDITFLGMH